MESPGGIRRFAQIAHCVTRHGLAHLLGPRIATRFPLSSWLPAVDGAAPVRLRRFLEDLGGTFIKFGQMLALQPDILPLHYCNALYDLLDRVEGFSYEEVERIVGEELGRSPQEIFDVFDPRPVATASVGQVHVAYLAGRKVAVKVQRPEASRQFRSDIQLMSMLLGLIRRLRLKPLYWMLEPMGEFVAWTHEELDYRSEAAYARRLRALIGDRRGQYVPEVFHDLTTRRVLVVEFLDGVSLLQYLRAEDQGDELFLRRLQAEGFDRQRFAGNVVDNFLDNAFRLGIYHADLHPANLMILPDSVVGYIDFGITGVMSSHARHHLLRMTLALARGDVEMIRREFLQITAYGPDSDPEALRPGLEALAAGWYSVENRDGSRQLSANFTRIMGEMLQLSRQTRVMPERDIVKFIRSSIAIDGLVTRFAPNFDLGEHLANTCGQYLQAEMRRQHLNLDQALVWSDASSRLLATGASRSIGVLDRLASTANAQPSSASTTNSPRSAKSTAGSSRVGTAAQRRSLRQRAVVLATAAFGVVCLLTLSGTSGTTASTTLAPRFDLWTAQILFVFATLPLLGHTLWRLNR